MNIPQYLKNIMGANNQLEKKQAKGSWNVGKAGKLNPGPRNNTVVVAHTEDLSLEVTLEEVYIVFEAIDDFNDVKVVDVFVTQEEANKVLSPNRIVCKHRINYGILTS